MTMGSRSSGAEARSQPINGSACLGEGAPASAAADVSPASYTSPLLNRGQFRTENDLSPGERNPAQPVTIRFPSPAGQKMKTIPWRGGTRIRHYLRDAGVLAVRFRCKMINGAGRRVRLNYIPEPGETVTLALIARAMS